MRHNDTPPHGLTLSFPPMGGRFVARSTGSSLDPLDPHPRFVETYDPELVQDHVCRDGMAVGRYARGSIIVSNRFCGIITYTDCRTAPPVVFYPRSLPYIPHAEARYSTPLPPKPSATPHDVPRHAAVAACNLQTNHEVW